MDNNTAMAKFLSKFSRLSEHDKKYIMTVQQTLLYTQGTGRAENELKVRNSRLKHLLP